MDTKVKKRKNKKKKHKKDWMWVERDDGTFVKQPIRLVNYRKSYAEKWL